ncbi:dynamin family protein [Sulfurimonas sp. NW15]|uniref:dynamin family protein n=1 Tax=Sulfurimonas sp. NW15 TaxID=2922729 RepID=UPI003DA980CB
MNETIDKIHQEVDTLANRFFFGKQPIKQRIAEELNDLLSKHNQLEQDFETYKEDSKTRLNILETSLHTFEDKLKEHLLKTQLISKLLSASTNNKGLQEFKHLLYNDFMEFANKENALANEAEMILKLQEIEKELEIISAYPLLHTKNVVAVGGGFSAGKSEFISSFIQSDVKLPIGVVPTTAIPTYVFHEEIELYLGCSSNGGLVHLSDIDKDFQSKLSHDFIKSFDFNLKDIMPYMMMGVKIDHDHICFIDTPGYNPATISDGFTSEDVKTAKDFLENANALVWLIGADANGTISASDLEFLDDLNIEDKKLYIVLNKADLKSPDDLEDILDEIEESLEEYDIEFEGISAYSSVLKETYCTRGISLDDFFINSDKEANKQKELTSKLYQVTNAYKNAILQSKKRKESAKDELHSLSLDLLETDLELVDTLSDRIETLKKLFLSEEEDENLKQLENITKKLDAAIQKVFH